ncbi:hypothetical protein GBA52_026860 [Prunus armeniaca]|nr:hypothetical protein GBA52_026860 [Prunus armeniaca]
MQGKWVWFRNYNLLRVKSTCRQQSGRPVDEIEVGQDLPDLVVLQNPQESYGA